MDSFITRRAVLRNLAASIAFTGLPHSLLTAQQSLTDSSDLMESDKALKTGEFLWEPAIAPEGPMLAVISLPVQRCYIYRNGILIGISTISTGKPGHQTPTGIFTVLQKQVHHKSNLYHSAPMPFMERLTWMGVAMHAGEMPGYPASHGCIRMPMGFAKLLYGVTSRGMTVVVTDLEAVPRVAPAPDLLQSEAATAATEEGIPIWQPEKSSSGPVSLILSAADKRLVVLRDGIMIGSSPANIEGAVVETVAYSLLKIDAAGFHWIQLPLPGQSWTGTHEMPASDRARVHIPESFRAALDGQLVPGTTLVVTADSLIASATGKAVTLLQAQP